MPKKPLLTFFCFLVWICLSAQTQLLDSLKKEVAEAGTDSLRLMRKMEYGIQLSKSDMQQGLLEIQEAIRQSGEKRMPYVHAASYHMLASLYYEAGNYINTITANEESEKLFLPLPDCRIKSHFLAAIYNDAGASYSLINDMEHAQDYYTKSAKYLEALRDTSNLVINHFNVAFIYIDMQEWRTASDFFRQAIDLANSMHPFTKTDVLVQLYARAAAMHFRLNEIGEGQEKLRMASGLMSQVKLDLSYNYFNNARGEYFYSVGNFPEALKAFREADLSGARWNDPYFQVDDDWEIGRSFLALHQTDSAEHYLRIALDTARRYNYLPKIRFIMNDWCDYYAQTGHFQQAYRLRTELLHFTDSLIGVQNHNRILLFDARYNSQQKESQIQELQQDKHIRDLVIQQKDILNYILIGSAVILLVISLLSYRNYRQKQKLQHQRISELETEKQLTATEAVLKGEEQERVRLAKDLHDGLGGMLSGIKYAFQSMKGNLSTTPESREGFERSMDMIDSSIKEMRRVAHNMMPEALVKFGLDTALRDFCTDIGQSGVLRVSYFSSGLEAEQIDQTKAIAVYRIVQELINNSIKHAQASSAIVQVGLADGVLTLTVEDDGRGFDPGSLRLAKGIGWSNIQSRVDFLKGVLDVKSAAGEGSSVFLEIRLNG